MTKPDKTADNKIQYIVVISSYNTIYSCVLYM